jgi:hypothetical protein
MNLKLPLALGAVTAAVMAPAAGASQLVDRNATGVKLEVNATGQALLTYRAGGKLKHVLAWGAVNAIPPTPGKVQVAFKLDYSGGGKQAQALTNACAPYDGPALAWMVTACTAPDGSYWAVQSWQRALPDYGVKATGQRAAWELRLSHWTGDLPVLTIHVDWSYRKFDHLYGTFQYAGTGVYGFKATPAGAPLDTFGRNLYVDTFNSAYGKGWRRENSFLTHAPAGAFCYGFYKHGAHPAGNGTRYRATIQGPGVTPDVMWAGAAPGPYDKAADAAANDEQRALRDPSCKVS